jgi:hypothetical protein
LYSKALGRYRTDTARCWILYSKATGRYLIGTEGYQILYRMGTGYCTTRLHVGTRQIQRGSRYFTGW